MGNNKLESHHSDKVNIMIYQSVDNYNHRPSLDQEKLKDSTVSGLSGVSKHLKKTETKIRKIINMYDYFLGFVRIGKI